MSSHAVIERLAPQFDTVDSSHSRSLPPLRLVIWTISVLGGFLQIWSHRFTLVPDSTNYLDIASAYLRADWHNAINAYWSPLLSWILALAIALVHPSPAFESTLLHLVNFCGFLLSLLGFEFFFRSLMRTRPFSGDHGQQTLPEIGAWVLGYSLFLSNALFVLSVPTPTPDVWVCAVTFFSLGLLVRIRVAAGAPKASSFALFGGLLAIAYFIKTFYFPLAFVFLLVAWFAAGPSRTTAARAALGLVLFALIAVPWIAVLSRSKHRFTFGDVGKIALAMTIDRLQQPLLWQGENGTGVPAHPTRLLHSNPRIVDFSSHPAGAYPPAYDWSYWMEGVRPHFYFRGLLAVLRQSFGTLLQILFSQIEFAVILVTLLLLATRSALFPQIRRFAYLWTAPLVACAGYAVVLTEPRYVAPFLPALWIAAFCCAFRAASAVPRRVALALVLAAAAATGLRVSRGMQTDLKTVLSRPQNVNSEVAQSLLSLGLRPGDRISHLGWTADPHWARQAGLTIVSEIPTGDENLFWAQQDDAKRQLFRILASTGAKMIVTHDPPDRAATEGWVRLGSTSFYAHSLPAQHESARNIAP